MNTKTEEAMAAYLKQRLRDFPGVAGIVIYNIATGERFEHNPRERFNAASLIKLPILWTLLSQAAQGKIDIDAPVTVDKADLVPGFGVLRHLSPGQRTTWRDLAMLMIIVSDNTATNMLIDELGKPAINRDIEALGLQDTALSYKMFETRPEGLFNTTSPADMAAMLMCFADATSTERTSASLGARALGVFASEPLRMLDAQVCNDKLPVGLPKGTRLAHKTGEVAGVEHDAGILFVNDQQIVIVVMTKDLKDSRDGAALCRDVARGVYDALANT